MGKEQDSKTISMSSQPARHKPSSPEQRLHSANAALREACRNYLSYVRGEEHLKPPTQHGYTTYPGIGNIYGPPLSAAEKATGSILNNPREMPLIAGDGNRVDFNYYIEAPRVHYQPDRIAGSRMDKGNLAYPPATIVSGGSVDGMLPRLPPRQAGGSTTANWHTTQYGETAFRYVMAPKQQNLEFHSTDDEGPRDTDRKRRAYQRYLYDVTGNSCKLMPAGTKKQPYNKSTAVSPSHHGGVMGSVRRSRLRESKSEDSD